MKKKILKISSILFVLFLTLLLSGVISEVIAQSPTATATASASPTATPTASPSTLPDAGVSLPTFFGIAVGVIAILLSLVLAF